MDSIQTELDTIRNLTLETLRIHNEMIKSIEAQLAAERTAHQQTRALLAGVQAIVDKERVLMPTNSFAQYARWYLAQQIRKALAASTPENGQAGSEGS